MFEMKVTGINETHTNINIIYLHYLRYLFLQKCIFE
jgi:hypothetical protein